MTKIIMMKGLPGSGKSTYAKELVKQGFTRINKDDLRSMLFDVPVCKFNPKLEPMILHLRDEAIRASLWRGKSVVVDDTNFEPKHAQKLLEIAKEENAIFEEVFIDTPLEECIKRDLKRPISVGEKVIRRMYNKYLRKIETPKLDNNADKCCVIIDIDGTLAHMKDRSPFDWKRVGEDTLDDQVFAVTMATHILGKQAAKIKEAAFETILMSGRDSVCRPETEAWLKENNIAYDRLFMRAEGDNRKDNLVKEEIYEREINGKYYVLCVFDDRDQVVEMWRNKGLKVLQVAEGDF